MIAVGRTVILTDQGDGWFAGYPSVKGEVEAVIPADAGGNPFYVVRLESPLELQEPGAATPSGFALRTYSHCILRSRWAGVDIGQETSVSVHVVLPGGGSLPRSQAEIAAIGNRIWASCSVVRP